MTQAFDVDAAVFDAFPNARFSVVLVRGADNHAGINAARERLAFAVDRTRATFAGMDPKSHPSIAVWREVFGERGWTPSRYLSSIEALVRRIVKGGEPPSINPAVDLANSVSLGHVVPIGAHDLAMAPQGFRVRLATDTDRFLPMGDDSEERPDFGEIVYAHGHEIRTRRWVWRQGRIGLVTEETADLLFPIDGFTPQTETAVRNAAETLADLVPSLLGGSAEVYHLDPAHPSTS